MNVDITYKNQCVQQAEHKGWCDALRNILGSLEGYPNAGGDKEIMTAVEKIVQQAVREELEWVDMRLSKVETKIGTRLWFFIQAVKDRLAAHHTAASPVSQQAGAPTVATFSEAVNIAIEKAKSSGQKVPFTFGDQQRVACPDGTYYTQAGAPEEGKR